MNRNIRNEGYITLEASIFLPMFIIGILTIAYLMKFIYAQENILYSICEEARRLSKTTYVINAAPLFPSGVENRLERENRDVEYVETEKFRYLYNASGLNGLIRYEAEYWMNIKLPMPLYEGFGGSETVVFRGMVGSKKTSKVFPFSEMEKEKPSDRVWVFPTAGERYHKRDCPYIIVLPTETILTDMVKRKYHTCSICGSKKLEKGNLVYCFYKTGEAYHSGKCPIVDRYVVEMEKETAVKKGYSPCSKCGG